MAVQGTGWTNLILEDGLDADHASAKYPLGTLVQDTRGNTYRYIKANEALTIGQAVTAVALAAWDTSVYCYGATSSGSTIEADGSASTMTVNQYAGYYVCQATAASKGISYLIKGHDVVATAGDQFTIFLEDAVAETFADNAPLYIFHPFLMEKVDATTEIVRGICIGSITSGQYGFIQVGGFVRAISVGHTTSDAIEINEHLVPEGTDVEGNLMGVAGNDEDEIMEFSACRILALEAVSADTKGFVPGFIVGQL